MAGTNRCCEYSHLSSSTHRPSRGPPGASALYGAVHSISPLLGSISFSVQMFSPYSIIPLHCSSTWHALSQSESETYWSMPFLYCMDWPASSPSEHSICSCCTWKSSTKAPVVCVMVVM